MVHVKKYLFTAFLWVISAGTAAALCSNSRISLITMDEGRKIYYAFGHSALRVTDSDENIDSLYNFGVMPDVSFLEYAKMIVSGRMRYMAEKTEYRQNLCSDIVSQHRTWRSTELLLTADEKIALYEYLENAVSDEKKYFYYDFISNNCATKIYDAISTLKNKDLSFTFQNLYGHETYRSQILGSLKNRPVSRFLINILLGCASDKKLDARTSSFLPAGLLENVRSARIVRKGEVSPLSGKEEIIYAPEIKNDGGVLKKEKQIFTILSFAIPFVLSVLIISAKKFRTLRKIKLLFSTFILLTAGFAGLVIFVMTFFVNVSAVKINFNFLYLNPLFLLIPFVAKKRDRKDRLRVLFVITLISLALGFLYCLFHKALWENILLCLIVFYAELASFSCCTLHGDSSS